MAVQHTCIATPSRPLLLVADRFVRCGQQRAIDLASGQSVRLLVAGRGSADRMRSHDERCASLFGLHHPALAELVDYGAVGRDEVFEAWRLPAVVRRWRARDVGTAETLTSVVRFLHARGLSAGQLSWRRVVDLDGCPVIVPEAATGMSIHPAGAYDSGRAPQAAALTGREKARLQRMLAACGGRDGTSDRRKGSGRAARVAEQADLRAARAAVDRIVELLDVGRDGEPKQVHLFSSSSYHRSLAVRMIAREARLRGYVPVSTACWADSRAGRRALAPNFLIPLLCGRHVLVIDSEEGGSIPPAECAGILLVKLAVASCRPNLLLSLHSVERSSAWSDASRTLRVSAASCGLPAAVACTASETRPTYGVPHPCGPPPVPRALRSAPDATVVRARVRAAEGIRLATQGRHAKGERLIRESLGCLVRRSDLAWAGIAAVDLGRVCLWRGRVRDAAQAFAEGRDHLDQAGLSSASIRAATYLGLAWTDLDRLTDAEAVLRSACITARELGDAEAAAFSSCCLARCLVWQSRWDSAMSAMNDAPALDASTTPQRDGHPTGFHERPPWEDGAHSSWTDRDIVGRLGSEVDLRVMRACLEARVALGRRDLAAAGHSVTRALEYAHAAGRPRELAAARTVAAAVLADIAELEGLRLHVADGLRAAFAAHVPLQAVRLRLLLVKGLRTAGREREGEMLALRLARIRPNGLPPLLRSRAETILRGESGLVCLPAPSPATPTARSVAQGRPQDGARRASESWPDLVAEIVGLVGDCHDAGDEAALLERIVGFIRQHTNAVSVAIFGCEPGGLAAVASAGCRPAPSEVARRACESGLAVMPRDCPDRTEAAVPVRHAGMIVGALGCRWPLGSARDPERLRTVLSMAAALAAPGVRAALDRRRCPVEILTAEPDLLGTSAPMVVLREAIARAANAPFPVLIEGESGSGKELVAKAIHRAGPRRDRKYHALNCAALADELLEAELFGHARGSFTGALADRPGLFEEADGGTIVLDEVGELSPRAQAKLLRVLQEGEVRRIGENAIRKVDVRVVAASNRPLESEVAAARFRRDLFYRLNVIRLAVPALRDRIEDVPLLASHFWAQAIARTGSRAALSPATLAALARHDWPGNVRELQNVMSALAVSAPRRGSVGPGSLPAALTGTADAPRGATLEAARLGFDQRYVRLALARAGGHRSRAARDLGLSRQGLAKLLVRLGITQRPD